MPIALLRRAQDLIPLPFHFDFTCDGQPILTVERQRTLRDRYLVLIHVPGLDRRLAAIPGVTGVETLAADRFRMTADRDVRPDAARAVVAANGSLRRLSVDEPSLEAIYARYFQTQSGEIQGARHAA